MSEIKIQPLADRVVVRPLTEEEAGTKSASGIILPESAKKEQAGEGVVVKVGAGKMDENGKRVAMEVKEGDRVVYSKYGFDEVKIDDQEYFIVGEPSILAILG
ncbi:MAG: chaperonin GroES [Patiriisocius sp.]|jgi:chaperonin GroES